MTSQRMPIPSSIFAAQKKGSEAVSELFKLGEQVAKTPPSARGQGLYTDEALADGGQPRSWLRELAASVIDPNTPSNMITIAQLFKALAGKATGKLLDDRELLLEYIVQWLSGLAPNSPLAATASGAFISVFYKDLQHPPAMSLGNEYRFRMWDGSNNNLEQPRLGAANTPYARSVSSKHPLPIHLLPEPSEIFDRVMRRPDHVFKEHPSGLSALFSAFATTVIHTVFRTDHDNPVINTTSSYVDLSIVYGHTESLVKNVRTGVNGLIHPDVVAEDRLFNLPAPVLALAVVFSRHHNFLADRLLKLNERSTFRSWDELDEAGQKAQDDELFGLARLLNCGHYAQVVLHDYLRSILGLTSTESTWVLDPRTTSSNSPCGGGNVVAVEFNMLYRWHATMSTVDADNTAEWLRFFLPEDRKDIPLDQLTSADFTAAFANSKAAIGVTTDDRNVKNWQHYAPKRGADGRFGDEDLARVILDATERPAHAFGARSTPNIMRGVEIAGMYYARNVWKCATLNEFRISLGLKPLESFLEFNTNKAIATAFEGLYGHPDNIELYAGLVCEETKPAMVGAGLCPGYTMSRAILSDAVALVRGDRFFTTAFDSGSLTAWGYEDCMAVPDNGAYGGFLPKLLHRALPNSFRYNSIHVQFPLQTKAWMVEHLKNLGVLDKYDTTRPAQLKSWRYITDATAVDAVLADPLTFNGPYKHWIDTFSIDPEHIPFMMGTEVRQMHDRSRRLVEETLYYDGFEADVEAYVSQKTKELIAASSYTLDDHTSSLDIVRDVTSIVFAHFWADQFGIPLKTEATPHAPFTVAEFSLMLNGLFAYVATNFSAEAAGEEPLNRKAQSVKILRTIIEVRLTEVNVVGGVASLVDTIKRRAGLDDGGRFGTMSGRAMRYYKALLKSNGTREESINGTFGMLVASITQTSDMTAQAVDLFLQSDQTAAYQRLQQLATSVITPAVRKELQSLFYESMRLASGTAALPRIAAKDVRLKVDEEPIKLNAGDRILVDVHALRNVEASKSCPRDTTTARPHEQYRLLGHGMRHCAGQPFLLSAAPAALHEIFALKALCRAPGASGRMKSFDQPFGGSAFKSRLFVDEKCMPFPFPRNMRVLYSV